MTLAIIPTYVRQGSDLDLIETTLRTLRETAGDRCEVLVIDDGSPAADLVGALGELCAAHDAEWHPKKLNEGFACSVNVGLRRCQLEGRDAVLVNADIEFGLTGDWLSLMERQRDEQERPAAVVGALLLYPSGLIQHAGIWFSLLSRDFSHRYQYAPGNLPEAQQAVACPVTGALQFIRHSTLERVGLYDERFLLGWEDVDYCARTWLHGLACVYQPGIRAVHHESAFRGRADERITEWTERSWRYFCGKYAKVSFAEFVPTGLAA